MLWLLNTCPLPERLTVSHLHRTDRLVTASLFLSRDKMNCGVDGAARRYIMTPGKSVNRTSAYTRVHVITREYTTHTHTCTVYTCFLGTYTHELTYVYAHV